MIKRFPWIIVFIFDGPGNEPVFAVYLTVAARLLVVTVPTAFA